MHFIHTSDPDQPAPEPRGLRGQKRQRRRGGVQVDVDRIDVHAAALANRGNGLSEKGKKSVSNGEKNQNVSTSGFL